MVPVYIGWPYEIKCEIVFSSLDDYYDDEATTEVSRIIVITISNTSEPKFLETSQ